MSLRNRDGFTLVELLVVIAIIGTLVALLLPAVQAAREAGRRATCMNNLRQLATACLQHESKHRHFPTGGWGKNWVGIPGRGAGVNQPGGWIYNILPYLEQQGLHDLGLPGTGLDVPDGSAQRLQTPLAALNCPSRRRADVFGIDTAEHGSPNETTPVQRMARSDYAINGGSVPFVDSAGGPDSLTDADTYTDWNGAQSCNGISYTRSMVKFAHVRDGASNTYLVGEKYIRPEHYTDGKDPGDNRSAYSADVNDIIRWTNNRPRKDEDGVAMDDRFGSVHSAGWHASFCDGSVRILRFSLNPETHSWLGSRADENPIDQSLLD